MNLIPRQRSGNRPTAIVDFTRKLPPALRRCALGLAAGLGIVATASAADVFTDNFDRADVDTGTTVGSTALGNGWTMQSDTQTTPRGGARITGSVLQIGQTAANGYAGPGGSDRTLVWQDASTWPAPYTTTLTNNPSLVTWTFNMRTGQGNPTPVSTSGGGTAVAVLATAEPGSGSWEFSGVATGYIVTYNDSSVTDPLKLIRMTNGIRNEVGHTALITASVSPFNDLSNQHLSVKVTYDPATEQWALFARNDGGSSFANPLTGNLTALGTATDSTYTGVPLPYMGFLGNSNNGTNGGSDDVRFDNLVVSVETEAAVPTFSPAEGTFPNPLNVTIASTTSGATIRYTTDGNEPTSTSGTIYTAPVAINQTTTLKAIAYRGDLADSVVNTGFYNVETAAPSFSPVPGSYFLLPQTVSLASATIGATIRYTTDGSEPSTTSGTIYTAPFVVNSTTVVKAIAYKDGLPDSLVNEVSYTFLTGAGYVFADNFERLDINTGTTVGSTALANGWTMHSDGQSPARGGARLNSGTLQIGQTTAGGYAGAGASDRSWVWQDSNVWSSPYTSTLANNTGLVTWTFNMRTGQPNPTPVSTSGGTTVVAVLATAEAGTGDWQFGGTATGYIVTYNDSTATDPLKLIRMTNGTRNEGGHTNLVTATTAPFNDLGNQHLSVKVTYNPTTNEWSLFARNDGGAFADPLTGSLEALGTAIDNTYTGTPLRYMGFLGNSNNGTNGGIDDLRFDNLVVTVTAVETDPYDVWAAQIPNANDRDRADDPDGDGFNNLLEFLFGTSPVLGNGSPTTVVSTPGNLTLRWLQLTEGASYTLEESTTLGIGSWTPVVSPLPALDGNQAGVPSGYQRFQVTLPTGPGRKFFRLDGVED